MSKIDELSDVETFNSQSISTSHSTPDLSDATSTSSSERVFEIAVGNKWKSVDDLLNSSDHKSAAHSVTTIGKSNFYGQNQGMSGIYNYSPAIF